MMETGREIRMAKATQHDLLELPHLLLDIALAVVEGDVGCILAVERRETEVVRLVAARGIPESIGRALHLFPPEGKAAEVLLSGEPAVLDARDGAPFPFLHSLTHSHVKTFLLFPLKTDGRTGGVMCLGSRHQHFSAPEMQLLASLSDRLGTVLLATVSFPLDPMHLRSYLESTTFDGAARLLEENLDVLLQLAIVSTHAKAGAFVLFSPQGGSVKLALIQGREELREELAQRLQPLVESDDDSQVDSKVLVSDPQELLERVRQALTDHHPLLSLPIPCRFGVVGALCLKGDDSYFPTLRQQELIERVLSHGAALIERAASLFELELAIWTDPLTGLCNRRFWELKLEEELLRGHRLGLPVSLAIVDIDQFKAINDSFGHPVGDEVLKKIALALRNNVRRYDVVARIGGDEFALLLPATPLSGALVVAERLRALVESLEFSDGTPPDVKVTVSIGVASATEYPTTVEDLVRMADDLLRAAKGEGKNRVLCAQQEGADLQPKAAPPPPFFDSRLLTALINRICHEVNNPAQGILGLAQLALKERAETLDEKMRRDLKNIRQAAERIGKVTRFLGSASYADIIRFAKESQP